MRFEYKVVTIKGSPWSSVSKKADDAITAELNTYGMNGWDIVGVTQCGTATRAFLKREK